MPSVSHPHRAPIASAGFAKTGLRIGALFWTPWLVLVIAATTVDWRNHPDAPFRFSILFAAIAPLCVLLYAGRWWATRSADLGDWGFLLIAIVQGFAFLLSIFFSLAGLLWLNGKNMFASAFDVDSTFVT